MKLMTTITPRRDGTVSLSSNDGKSRFVFVKDESGQLVCDVTDEVLVLYCLASGNFEPADEGDFDAAEALMAAKERAQAVADVGENEDEGSDEAPPLESMTPPRAKPAPKGKARH